MQKDEIGPLPYPKVNSVWVKDFLLRPEGYKTRQFCNTDLGTDFLDMTPKTKL